MTHDDDDDVTVPGDDEVIAELRRRAALDAAAPEDDSDDDVTLEAEPSVIAEIRAAAADAAGPELEPEPDAPDPTPLPPPQLGTLPPPQVTPVSQAPAATQPAGARWQPTGRLPVAQRVESGRTVPARVVRARWYLMIAVAAAAVVLGAIFSLRDDGDEGPAPATTEAVTTTSP